ncbi:MAG TPA: BspA family leucine-rich repeat surface protein [Candidatus Scybalocola faecipullorum]|nr:BspA family leucine-rich repeat surface protein [Candidatus Scybalocola faecipullorum]
MNTDFQYIQDSQPSEYRTLLFCSTPSKAFLAQLGKSLCPARPSTASAFYIENPPSTLPADFIAKLAIQAHGVFPDFKREKITSIIFKNTLRRAPKDHYDVSADQNGSIIAWVNTEMLHNYRIYIAAKGGVACEDCKQMFYDCKSLRNIDFNHCFDTSRASSMFGMFGNTPLLTSLDLSCFNTENVTNMSRMFDRCGALSINLSSFTTSRVWDIYGMFDGCCVEQLDLRHFDTSRVTSMSNMFAGCADLEVLDIRGWNTSNVYSMDKMFYRCVSLSPSTEGMITALDQSKVVSAALMVTETPFESSLLPLELAGLENDDMSKETLAQICRLCRHFARKYPKHFKYADNLMNPYDKIKKAIGVPEEAQIYLYNLPDHNYMSKYDPKFAITSAGIYSKDFPEKEPKYTTYVQLKKSSSKISSSGESFYAGQRLLIKTSGLSLEERRDLGRLLQKIKDVLSY